MIVIVGAGIVGCALAYVLAQNGREVYLLEKESRFGQGVSSRNSGVLHAGLYYPRGSLKQLLCLRGNLLMRQFCQRHHLPLVSTKKLIVANTAEERAVLETLLEQAPAEAQLHFTHEIPEGVSAKWALESPNSGIFDAHAVMQTLVDQGTFTLLTHQKVEKLSVGPTHPRFLVEGEWQEAEFIINAAGLDAMALADFAPPELYARGAYFKITQKPPVPLTTLVYPAVPPQQDSLGIHLTVNLQGELLLGPDLTWVSHLSYVIDPREGDRFFEAGVRWFPWLKRKGLEPDFVGFRPKLKGNTFADFHFQWQEGILHCLGIESPGLTACLAIAETLLPQVNRALHPR